MNKMMKAFVYILKDSKSKFYIGSTSNINRRLIQHKNGHTQTTKRMDNPELVFAQEYESLLIARKVERKIKNLKRRDYLEKIIKDGKIRMFI